MRMNGVSEILYSLPTFSGVPFFFLDEMHLFGGVAQLVFKIIDYRTRNRYIGEKGDRWYLFNLVPSLASNTGMATLNAIIKKCATKIPEIFEGSFQASFKNYRSVDWQNFLCVIIPNILLHHMVNSRAKDALMNLVNGCNLALRREIKESQLIRLTK